MWEKSVSTLKRSRGTKGGVKTGRTIPEVVLLRVQNVHLVDEDQRLHRSLDLERRLNLLHLLLLPLSLHILRRSRSLLRKHAEQVPSTSLPRTRPDEMILPNVADIPFEVVRPPLADTGVDLEDLVPELVSDRMDGRRLATAVRAVEKDEVGEGWEDGRGRTTGGEVFGVGVVVWSVEQGVGGGGEVVVFVVRGEEVAERSLRFLLLLLVNAASDVTALLRWAVVAIYEGSALVSLDHEEENGGR